MIAYKLTVFVLAKKAKILPITAYSNENHYHHMLSHKCVDAEHINKTMPFTMFLHGVCMCILQQNSLFVTVLLTFL